MRPFAEPLPTVLDIERRARLLAVPALNIQLRKTATSERLSSGRLAFTASTTRLTNAVRVPGFVRKCFHFSQQNLSRLGGPDVPVRLL
jgi:hypothetical protein